MHNKLFEFQEETDVSMTIRKHLEEIERKTLRPEATLSINSRGRKIPESCDLRTCFQQDRDKILHSKAFRRLGHKTQVFLLPLGDHYRTRFTHTLEVSQIARSIARALSLNESLAEAISLGHDLGHTPFGHIGEQVLDEIYPDGFHHVMHSVRIVEKLEKNGRGLNLSFEVIDGIKKHSKGRGPIITDDDNLKAATLEGQIVRLSDIMAYINHDIDDAIRGGLLNIEKIPADLKKTLGTSTGERINRMITDVIVESMKRKPFQIAMTQDMENALKSMRDFMFREVYESTRSNRSYAKIHNLIKSIYDFYVKNPGELEKETGITTDSKSVERFTCDFIAGMTDRFAIHTFNKLFIPPAWSVI